jgi:hypothetical protein
MIANTKGSEESFKEEDRAGENKNLVYLVCSCVMKGN